METWDQYHLSWPANFASFDAVQAFWAAKHKYIITMYIIIYLSI